ncbi:MAG: bifunctional nuclease family protein [Candidatus Aenigmarchaeota archaeon]|nr:bifunctional nuclease family protein [Candidatus Aenigmarchaeota archaeon]
MKRKFVKESVILMYRITILILILIIVFLSFWILIPSLLVPNIFVLPELSTLGYTQVAVTVEIGNESGTVKLAEKCYELSMVVDRSQAVSIDNGIKKIVSFRPNTHDLINDMLKSFDIKVIMVKVTEMKNNTYFAKLLLGQRTFVLGLDSRPSDAIAIAARTDYEVPIYVNESLLKTVGKRTC